MADSRSGNQFCFYNYASAHWFPHVFRAPSTTAQIGSLFLRLLENRKVNLQAVEEFHTLLSWAVEIGYTAAVRLLLNNGQFNVNQKGPHGNGVLHVAAAKGHEALTTLLLEHPDTDANSVNDGLKTSIFLAAENGNAVTVKILLESDKIDYSKPNSLLQPLCIASLNGHASVVELLLDSDKLDTNQQNFGWGEFQTAAGKGQVQVVTAILNSKKLDKVNGQTKMCGHRCIWRLKMVISPRSKLYWTRTKLVLIRLTIMDTLRCNEQPRTDTKLWSNCSSPTATQKLIPRTPRGELHYKWPQ